MVIAFPIYNKFNVYCLLSTYKDIPTVTTWLNCKLWLKDRVLVSQHKLLSCLRWTMIRFDVSELAYDPCIQNWTWHPRHGVNCESQSQDCHIFQQKNIINVIWCLSVCAILSYSIFHAFELLNVLFEGDHFSRKRLSKEAKNVYHRYFGIYDRDRHL